MNPAWTKQRARRRLNQHSSRIYNLQMVQQMGGGNDLVSLADSDIDNPSDRPTNRIKRRRLNPSDDVDPDSDSNNNDEDATFRIRSESKDQKMVTALTKKIQQALDKKFPAEKKRDINKVGSKHQMQSGCTDVVVSDFNARGHLHAQTGSTDAIVSDFNVRFERGNSLLRIDPYAYRIYSGYCHRE